MRKAGEVTYVDAHNRMGRGKSCRSVGSNSFLSRFLGRGEACFVTRDDLYKALDTLQSTQINGKAIKLTIKVRVTR